MKNFFVVFRFSLGQVGVAYQAEEDLTFQMQELAEKTNEKDEIKAISSIMNQLGVKTWTEIQIKEVLMVDED